MPVTVKVASTVHVQHAELNTIISFFQNYYSMGIITITKIATASASAALAAGVTGAAIAVTFTGPGGAGKGGTEVFGVPGPEVGSGISFAVAATVAGLFAVYRARRSSAI